MLNVSIVIYKHTISDISPLVEILQNSGLVSEIFLIDNSPKENKDFGKLNANYIFNNCNLGYGKAHNIALRKSIQIFPASVVCFLELCYNRIYISAHMRMGAKLKLD